MNDSDKRSLTIAFVIVVVLFVLFGGGMIGGGMYGGGGGMMGGGHMMGDWTIGGFQWMWLPTLLVLILGILIGWVIWGKK